MPPQLGKGCLERIQREAGLKVSIPLYLVGKDTFIFILNSNVREADNDLYM